MIPKVIHYCWFGGKPLPKSVKKCISSWRKYCPDYKIVQWDESNFDVKSNNFISEAYKAKAWAFVSDYARLKIIYEQGGIYLDTDVEIIRNPDFLLNHRAFIGVQYNGKYCTTGLGFGAEQYNPIIREMLNCYDGLVFDYTKKESLACPILNSSVIRKHGYCDTDAIVDLNNITVYPSRFFDPYPSGADVNLMCEDTVSIHHYAALWTSKKQQIKRKFAMFIGEKNILTIKRILSNRKD